MNIQSIAKNTVSSHAGFAALVLRVPVGVILAAHGAQKLFGWFGGYGLEGTAQWMASIGFEPGLLMALLAGGAEFFGGLALIVGLLVRPAAAVAAFTMLVAMTQHVGNGLFVSNNGYEFALALLAATIALTLQGAGKLSFDAVIQSKLNAAHS